MAASNASHISVVLPVPVRREFHYRVPAPLGTVAAGCRVRVPFGRRVLVGFCVGAVDRPGVEPARLREVIEVLDDQPIVGPPLRKLARWIADYYACSWGEVLEATVPAAVKHNVTSRRDRVVVLARPAAEVHGEIERVQDRWPSRARLLRLVAGAAEPMTERSLRAAAHLSTSSSLRTLQRQGWIACRPDGEGMPAFEVAEPEGIDHVLTPAQQGALAAIAGALDGPAFRVFLLHGVTGSGKTEVYLRAIENVVAAGRQAIVLVPEIALTPQGRARFSSRFPRTSVLHSQQSAGERNQEWQRIRRGETDVVLGPRSAVFAPVPALGVVVVDEEHEPAFKQQSAPRYNGRDVAVVRARDAGVPVILGSATPALESFHNARRGKYTLVTMPERVAARRLPEVHVVDMAAEQRMTGQVRFLSRLLVNTTRETLEAGGQVIYFLNRRGFSTFLTCRGCGWVARCDRCAIGMTYHRTIDRSVCHYCYREVAPPERCPECGLPGVRYFGAGTQKVEETARVLFEGARIARVDSDTMSGKRYDQVLGAFGRRELDMLIGTQMIAKGLDFPGVQLIGVVSADTLLNFPDLRAAERTFQLVTQVAGRCGRGEAPGLVVVQTFHPTNHAIRCATRHDFAGFAEHELRLRRELGYPPFGRMVRFVVSGPQEDAVERRARKLHREVTARAPRGVTLLGPAPCPIPKIKNDHRWHLLARGPDGGALRALHEGLAPGGSGRSGPSVTIDVDPIDML